MVEFKEGVAVLGGRSWGTNRTVAAVRLAYIDDSGLLSSARSYASVVCKVIGVCHLQGHRHPSTNYFIALHVICLRVQHDVVHNCAERTLSMSCGIGSVHSHTLVLITICFFNHNNSMVKLIRFG